MIVGVAYAIFVSYGFQPLRTAAIVGGISGGLIGSTVGGLDIFYFRSRRGTRVAQAPFLVSVLVKGLLYGLVIAIVVVGQVPSRLVSVYDPASFSARNDVRGVVFAIVITIAFLFVLEISQLVGGRNLRRLVMGRYHTPRVEDRFFLFVDVRGSTGIAERLGAPGVHAFLNRVFTLAADPVAEARGEIHQYVGDEMVVTWPVSVGRVSARPLACFFGIETALNAAAAEFHRDFGVGPRVRASLHAGEVVTGEVGATKREIVFHGDVMNTASRLEHLAGELDHRVVASADAVKRLDGTNRYLLKEIGQCQVRGREQAIEVYAVSL
jgi:adenylate cyclase